MDILKKNKKGSHVGIVLSFTLFITSIIFLYNIVGLPLKVMEEKSMSLDLIKSNFEDYVKEDFVVVRMNGNGACASIETPSNSFSDIQSFATNGEEIGSSISGGYTTISPSSGNVKVYYSNSSLDKNLFSSDTGCNTITPSSISYGRFISENLISYAINESIYNESMFRENIEISDDDEFSIIFEYPNNTRIGEDKTENRNIKLDIYSREYLIDYISMSGENEVGRLNVKVW